MSCFLIYIYFNILNFDKSRIHKTTFVVWLSSIKHISSYYYNIYKNLFMNDMLKMNKHSIELFMNDRWKWIKDILSNQLSADFSRSLDLYYF